MQVCLFFSSINMQKGSSSTEMPIETFWAIVYSLAVNIHHKCLVLFYEYSNGLIHSCHSVQHRHKKWKFAIPWQFFTLELFIGIINFYFIVHTYMQHIWRLDGNENLVLADSFFLRCKTSCKMQSINTQKAQCTLNHKLQSCCMCVRLIIYSKILCCAGCYCCANKKTKKNMQ